MEDRIKVGLIGYGMSGEFLHAPLINSVPGLHFSTPNLSHYYLTQYDLGSHLIDQALYLFGLPERVMSDLIVKPEEACNSIRVIELAKESHEKRATVDFSLGAS